MTVVADDHVSPHCKRGLLDTFRAYVKPVAVAVGSIVGRVKVVKCACTVVFSHCRLEVGFDDAYLPKPLGRFWIRPAYAAGIVFGSAGAVAHASEAAFDPGIDIAGVG